MSALKSQSCLISIIIPVHNRTSTVLKAINSVLNQSISNTEILIIDDGSNDETTKFLLQLVSQQVRVLRLDKNHGAQAARNFGIQEARGKFLVFLDSDDELLPDSLDVRLRALQESEWQEALVYGDVLRNRVTDKFEFLKGYVYPYLLKELSLCPYSAMLIPKSCFSKAGLPNHDFPSWQDDDMVLTIGKHFPVIHSGSPVARMNVLANRISGNKWGVVEGCRRMVDKYSNEILQVHGSFRLFCWKVRIWRGTLIALYDDVNLKLRQKFSFLDLLRLVILYIARVLVRILLTPFFRHFYG